MKKNECLALVLLSAALSILTGCSKKSDTMQNNARLIWSYSNIADNGMFYSDDEERLNFLDFESMNTTVLCSKPNCAHNDSQTCSSFGISNHPILYDNKLYYFDVEHVIDKDENYKDITAVYRSETDGTGRVPLYKADDMSIAPYYRMILTGDTAYFYTTKQGNDRGNSTGCDIGYFCSYNITANEFKVIDKIYEGYHSGAWLYGAWNNKIYFSVSYSKEKIDVPIGGDKEAFDKFHEALEKAVVDEYMVYDPETNSITQSELPYPVYVGEGFYAYEKEGGLALLPENGDEVILSGYKKKDSLYIFNGIMFNITDKTCVKPSEGGAKRSLNISDSQSIEAFHNGSYIIKEVTVDDNGTVLDTKYKKTTEAELVGEKIE